MEIVIVIVSLLLAVVIWWDCTIRLGGLNHDLDGNHSEWRKKTIKHFKLFFPRMNRLRSTKKIIPSELYVVIYAFQIAVHALFLIWTANSVVCLILYLIDIKFQIRLYWGVFTLAVMLLGESIVGVASFVCYRECKRLQAKQDMTF